MSQQEGPGGMPGEKLCFSQGSEDLCKHGRPTNIEKLTLKASQAQPPSLWSSPIYTFQTSRDLHMSCLSTCIFLSWHHSANQPKSTEAARSCNISLEVFWCILYGGPTNAAQLCNVRQTNTWVSLTKNPSSRVLSCACFSKTSFLLCLLHKSALVFHLCPFQENIPSHVCPSKTPSNQLSKEPLSFHIIFLYFFHCHSLMLWTYSPCLKFFFLLFMHTLISNVKILNIFKHILY
jgi:hypothetical protein